MAIDLYILLFYIWEYNIELSYSNLSMEKEGKGS